MDKEHAAPMVLLEALLGASIAFTLGVPAFFEKVMRPGYEEKTRMYRRELYDEFRETLRETTEEFGQWGDITEEADVAMNALVELWVKVRNQARRFEVILHFRSFLTVLWLFTTAVVVGALYYQDLGMSEMSVNWHLASFSSFIACLALTLLFVMMLFDFDRRLLKVSVEPTKEAPARVVPVTLGDEKKSIVELWRELENRVNGALTRAGIPFVRCHRHLDRSYDFLIPNADSPRVAIELKYFGGDTTRRRPPKYLLDGVMASFVHLKEKYPHVRAVLVTNIEAFREISDPVMRKWIDAVFHDSEMDRFVSYVREFVQM